MFPKIRASCFAKLLFRFQHKVYIYIRTTNRTALPPPKYCPLSCNLKVILALAKNETMYASSLQVINENKRACESCKCVPHFAIKVNE